MPWRSLVNPFRNRGSGVHVERDIAYNGHGRRGLLDVYTPEGGVPDGGAPVLLQVHGGAWTIGTKEQQGLPLMQHLARKGWVCVAINYRLAPRDAFPAQIIDVKQAIAWIKEHIAAYGGDPDYVAITGGSAGGHLASLAALTADDRTWQPGFEDADCSVQAAVPHYGVYDVAGSTGLRAATLMRDGFFAPKVMQTTWAEHPERFEAASSILRITPDAPDFFVLHGSRDTLVPVEQARLFVGEAAGGLAGARSSTPSSPGPSTPSTSSPRSGRPHIVRTIDRYLHWHWNVHRRAQAHGRAPAQAGGRRRTLSPRAERRPAVSSSTARALTRPTISSTRADSSATSPGPGGAGVARAGRVRGRPAPQQVDRHPQRREGVVELVGERRGAQVVRPGGVRPALSATARLRRPPPRSVSVATQR